jgi:hypothetical protein
MNLLRRFVISLVVLVPAVAAPAATSFQPHRRRRLSRSGDVLQLVPRRSVPGLRFWAQPAKAFDKAVVDRKEEPCGG